jgi:outer membrane receptor protein involved in Fe transport
MQYRFAVLGYEAFARADSIYVGPFYGDLRQSEQTRSGDYLKIDASVRVAIRNLSVDLFVRNLTKEDAFTFRGIGGLGDFYGYRLRPRTFGVQLGYDF